MSDLIFKKDGEEYFCIPSPFSNNYYHLPKCPETKLEIKMTEQKITLELTLDELKLIDKHLWISVATKPILEKIKNAYPQQKSDVEESYIADFDHHMKQLMAEKNSEQQVAEDLLSGQPIVDEDISVQ